jgi:hypothetical protein
LRSSATTRVAGSAAASAPTPRPTRARTPNPLPLRAVGPSVPLCARAARVVAGCRRGRSRGARATLGPTGCCRCTPSTPPWPSAPRALPARWDRVRVPRASISEGRARTCGGGRGERVGRSAPGTMRKWRAQRRASLTHRRCASAWKARPPRHPRWI